MRVIIGYLNARDVFVVYADQRYSSIEKIRHRHDDLKLADYTASALWKTLVKVREVAIERKTRKDALWRSLVRMLCLGFFPTTNDEN
jgi:hypothetical protein